MSMRLGLALLTLFALPAVSGAAPEAICNNSDVFLCENWSDRALGNGDLTTPKFKSPGWFLGTGSAATVSVVSGIGPDGTMGHLANFHYPANNPPSVGKPGAGYMTSASFGHFPDLYVRFYIKWSSSFIWSTISTKLMEINYQRVSGVGFGIMNTWISNFDSNQTQTRPWFVDKSTTGTDENIPQNVGSKTMFPDNQWHCFEAHMKMNTTGTDGILEGWIDGVQYVNYPAKRLSDQDNDYFDSVMLSGYWNCAVDEACQQPTDRHPDMDRWDTNIVFSTNRYGCLSGGGPTPPAAPTGLRFASLVGFLIAAGALLWRARVPS